MRKSFTLIELIVVIGIIAVLSALGATSYTGFQKNARDTRRKQDLKTITSAINQYYARYNRFPPAVNAATTCADNTWCCVDSTQGESWISGLVPTFIEKLPQDPVNNAADSLNTDDGYSYMYCALHQDGQTYDLITRLENKDDPDRCEIKNYKINDKIWEPCSSGQPDHRKYIYDFSPDQQ